MAERGIGLTLTVVAVLAAACGPSSSQPSTHVTATPLPSASPSPSPSPLPSPSPSPTPVARPPTDADRARFASSHRPEGATNVRHVAVDVDGDDIEELVFAMILDGDIRVEIAWWQGTGHAIEAAAVGVAASRVDSIAVQDVNGDGLTEVGVAHGRDNRAGLVLWVVRDRSLDEVEGEGGCVDGNNFGDRGAHLADADGDDVLEIVGTCEALFGVFGSSATWWWNGDVYSTDDARDN